MVNAGWVLEWVSIVMGDPQSLHGLFHGTSQKCWIIWGVPLLIQTSMSIDLVTVYVLFFALTNGNG